MQENVEIVRRSFEAIGRWDIDGLLDLYDPEIEFLPLTGIRVESGGYRGHLGVRAYFEEVSSVWDVLRPYGDDFRIAGDSVVVLGGCAVRGHGSGAETDTPMAWMVTVRDGRITHHRGYARVRTPLAAAGLWSRPGQAEGLKSRRHFVDPSVSSVSPPRDADDHRARPFRWSP